ncbi:MAG TPA: protein-glutamate O-methyltransferase CheR [Thermoanaerobaculia bacterium]|nr:protein-glutamate O-methyltransferase CheR [Thermoanaerobaculia bacterium]
MISERRVLEAAPPIAAPTEDEFGRFQHLIESVAGIYLSEAKRALLISRLWKRVRACGVHSFAEYHALVSRDDAERGAMIDAICTNETHFFREPRQFDYIKDTLVPEWRRKAACGERQKTIRVWSAGCSSGEEPYSIAMLLLAELPASEGWTLRIRATDLSSKVLEQARQGRWVIARAAEIPDAYLRHFMLRGVGSRQGMLKAGQEVRSVIEFGRLNLMDPPVQVGSFDLIFCRNVMIYFRAPVRDALQKTMIDQLAPHGHFFLGHAESISASIAGVRRVIPNVYAI